MEISLYRRTKCACERYKGIFSPETAPSHKVGKTSLLFFRAVWDDDGAVTFFWSTGPCFSAIVGPRAKSVPRCSADAVLQASADECVPLSVCVSKRRKKDKQVCVIRDNSAWSILFCSLFKIIPADWCMFQKKEQMCFCHMLQSYKSLCQFHYRGMLFICFWSICRRL